MKRRESWSRSHIYYRAVVLAEHIYDARTLSIAPSLSSSQADRQRRAKGEIVAYTTRVSPLLLLSNALRLRTVLDQGNSKYDTSVIFPPGGYAGILTVIPYGAC